MGEERLWSNVEELHQDLERWVREGKLKVVWDPVKEEWCYGLPDAGDANAEGGA